MAFLDYLVQKGILDSSEGDKLRQQVTEAGTDLVDVLVGQGMDHGQLMQWKSEYYSVPIRTATDEAVPLDVLKYIPEDSALHYQFVPLAFVDNVLEVGMVDPDNLEARDALQFISSRLNLPFKLFLISYRDFKKVTEGYQSLSGQVSKALSGIEEEGAGATPEQKEENLDVNGDIPSLEDIDQAAGAPEDEAAPPVSGIQTPSPSPSQKKADFDVKIVEDTPITKIVAVLLRHATEGRASDVHIEPGVEKVKVRFRVDGVLYTSLFLPIAVHKSVVARIKVLSKLKLDERRKPQDGSFSARIEKRKIDFRVSTFPTNHGEKVVMRILDPGKGIKSLEETGLRGRNLEYIRDAIKKPFGLVLITGPTGSGKSTSLYAMLNELDTEEQNVVSLEDPIEYNVEGISQSQVRPEISYSFANGLRSILRQDPDVIMVGEIRDKETAQLAIQAALTGHLVLSTLHTNNAAGVVPRLIDMGVDPYLIAPTLLAVIGQRLVPTLCEQKRATPVEGSLKEMVTRQFSDLPEEFRADIPQGENVYDTEPSAECPGGTKGRIGIFEVMRIDKELEKVILDDPVEMSILKAARTKGMFTMKEDALFKSFEGLVPFHEVNKFE